MHFVYPFIHSKANDRELQLSIASVRKNYQGESKIIVIGDRPAFEVDVMIEQPRSGGAFRDQIQKLWSAIKSKDVADRFVWMMDDIWFVKPITEVDLRTPRHSGYRDNLYSWKPSNNWLKSKKRTMIELRSRGFDQYDYSNHCPQFLDKTNVREMFVEWNLMNTVWEWKTIYQNVYGKNALPCRPYRWRWNGPKSEEKLRKGFSSCSIANCNSSGFDNTANEFISQFLGVPSMTTPTRSRRLVRIQKSKKLEVELMGPDPNRYYLKRKPPTTPSHLDEIGKRKNSEKPCPGQHRGSCVDVKNNKLCSKRSKRSVPVYECDHLKKLVTIEPYTVGQPEGCCKRCDVFWEDSELPIAVTSLIPRPDDPQTRALKTWKDKGLTICAVQPSGEIETCSKLYPEVDQWVELSEKGLPKISDILKAASCKFAGKDIMLINADIEIDVNRQFPKIDKEVMAFPRYDYSVSKDETKKARGLDVFMFPAKSLRLIIDAPFQIGQPWWDYWIPFHFIQLNHPISIINDEIFFHERHRKRWRKSAIEMRKQQVIDLYNIDGSCLHKFRKKLRKYERLTE